VLISMVADTAATSPETAALVTGGLSMRTAEGDKGRERGSFAPGRGIGRGEEPNRSVDQERCDRDHGHDHHRPGPIGYRHRARSSARKLDAASGISRVIGLAPPCADGSRPAWRRARLRATRATLWAALSVYSKASLFLL